MKTLRRWQKRFGRRGTILGLFGVVWVLYGFAQFTGPESRFGNLGTVVTTVINSRRWGALWIVCGLVAVVIALMPRRRGDGRGFAALLIPAVGHTATYTLSWVLFLATGVYGTERAWVAAIIWAVEVVTVLVCASWPDPDQETLS